MQAAIKKREMKLSDYHITIDKYNELKYFCKQYDEKKRELHKNYGLESAANDGLPKGNTPGNPTEKTAIKNMMLQRDIELIEQTVMEADATIYKWLLKNVTQGISYEYLNGVPKNRTDFYCSRRYFFYLLSQKK